MKIFLIFALFVAQAFTFTLEGKEFDSEAMELDSNVAGIPESDFMAMEVPEIENQGLDRRGRGGLPKWYKAMLAKCGLKPHGKGAGVDPVYRQKLKECREKYGKGK